MVSSPDKQYGSRQKGLNANAAGSNPGEMSNDGDSTVARVLSGGVA
jgi:hypothetical protein